MITEKTLVVCTTKMRAEVCPKIMSWEWTNKKDKQTSWIGHSQKQALENNVWLCRIWFFWRKIFLIDNCYDYFGSIYSSKGIDKESKLRKSKVLFNVHFEFKKVRLRKRLLPIFSIHLCKFNTCFVVSICG